MKNKLKVLLNNPAINALYRLYKIVYKFLHKGLTAGKAMLNYIKWLFAEKKSFYGYVKKQYNVKKIKPLNPIRWKNGVKYFVGETDGQKVFIKTPGIIDTTKREIHSLVSAKTRSDYLDKHTPAIISDNIDDGLLIEEMIEGTRLDKIRNWDDDISKKEVIEQIYRIYCELVKARIIHMDIRPGNFIVRRQNDSVHVYLIDFGFALVDSRDLFEYIDKDKTTINILKKLGSEYSLRNGTWDDAYSFLMTLKKIDPSFMCNYYDIWKYLNNDIGVNTVSLK